MRESENIRDVEMLGIDLMGFIFYAASPRYVSEVPDYLPTSCQRVGVFVNENSEKIIETAKLFKLDFLQLHGHETPEQCSELKALGYKIIKAFSIANTESLKTTKDYTNACDYLLFDTSCPGYGGSGKSFNWQILKQYKGKTPFLLSGGLSLENISLLKEFSHPSLAGYDLNSGFENMPAVKNTYGLKTFISNIKDNE